MPKRITIWLGALKEKGQFTEALTHFKEAVRLKPGLPVSKIGLTWLLATHPEAQPRDPAQAIILGEQLAEWSHNENWMALDALAAAYAAVGRFGDAMKTARKALDLVRKISPRDAQAVTERLALYEQGKPYREAARHE